MKIKTKMKRLERDSTDRNVTCWRIFSVLLLLLYTVIECEAIDCGQTPQRSSDNITSPNYPGNYPNGAACKWHISLGSTEMITIRFISFNTIGSKSCREGDKLTISYGSDEVDYCGSALPPPYISNQGHSESDSFIIKFTSDSKSTSSGFMIEYFKGERQASSCNRNEFQCRVGNCIPQWWVCDDYKECLDTTDEASCVKVYTTPMIQCPTHKFLCRLPNNTQACLPESVKCDGHKDCKDNVDEESCESVCSHFLEGVNGYGYFESPNFPQQYDPNLDCFWVLTVLKGSTIQLRFDVFDLEQPYSTDYVKVYDGSEETDKLIGTYYGAIDSKNNKGIHMPPAVIDGSGNQLRVTLVTDDNVSARGFNATFQVKGDCIAGQTPCGADDSNCFDDKQHCNNFLDCMKGLDELGCSTTCGKIRIPCFHSNKGCFIQEERCDGQQNCAAGEDEKDCDPSLCNTRAGLFRCSDGTCIEERYTCNSANDCLNGEDEENCYVSTNVVTAAAVGSIVCGLLLVAALSCTCKLYQLHVRERLPPSHMSPLREIEEELLRREAPPSYTATMASPHFDEAQRAFIEGIQAAVIARNESRGPSRSSGGGRRQRSTFVRMLSRERPRSGSSGAGSQQQMEQEDSTTQIQSEALPPSPDGESTTTPEEIVVSDNPPPPLRRISGDLSSPTVSPSPAEAIPLSSGEQEQESASSSVSDTDSETNQDALHLATRDQQILRAAANIRRMRLAGGLQNVLQAQDHRAARARSRTGSLVDAAATDSAPEDDSGTSTPQRDPDLVAEVGLPNENSNSRTHTTDEGLTSATLQDTTDESSAAQDESAQAGGRSTPVSDRAPSDGASTEDKINNKGEEAVYKDSNEERLSHASSILSLQSCSSEHTADDVPLLST